MHLPVVHRRQLPAELMAPVHHLPGMVLVELRNDYDLPKPISAVRVVLLDVIFDVIEHPVTILAS